MEAAPNELIETEAVLPTQRTDGQASRHRLQGAVVDPTMPLRMLHFVACFDQHLLKTKVTTPAKGLPPILPIVLYNGLERWHAAEDIDAYRLMRLW